MRIGKTVYNVGIEEEEAEATNGEGGEERRRRPREVLGRTGSRNSTN